MKYSKETEGKVFSLQFQMGRDKREGKALGEGSQPVFALALQKQTTGSEARLYNPEACPQ